MRIPFTGYNLIWIRWLKVGVADEVKIEKFGCAWSCMCDTDH